MGKAPFLMHLAVVGWGGDSGVGRELIDAVRNLPVGCAFILPNKIKGTRKDLLREIPCFFASRENLDRQMELFIEAHRPDTVLTWEVPGNWSFPDIWKANKIRWVHMVHWDWFDASTDRQSIWKKAFLLAPNRMCQKLLEKHYDLHAHYLPVPVDTERLQFQERRRANVFVSIYGYGGARDRRSIPEVFSAWRSMGDPPELLLRAQQRPGELEELRLPPRVKLKIGNTREPGDLYDVGDVAVQPSRYEGVGVSMIEAQARGVPVITVDAPPMNEIAPELMVPCEKITNISIMGKKINSYTPSVPGIMKVVKQLQGTDISALSRHVRERVERTLSWTALRPEWLNILNACR